MIQFLRSIAISVVGALIFGAAATAAVQEPTDGEIPVFSESIQVRVINVEVVVTDRKGKRVRDLEPSDFRVTVDGEPIAIDFFTEIAEGDAATSLVATGSDVDGPVPEGETVQTRYLIFIDNLFSQRHHRDLVLEALEEDVAGMRPDEWMAVVQFDGAYLELLTGWTNDHDRLEAAFQQARATDSKGMHRLSELRRVDEFRQMEQEIVGIFEQSSAAPSLPFGGGGDGGGGGGGRAEEQMEALKALILDNAGAVEIDYAQLVSQQVRWVALSAAAAMRGLSDVGGRKAVMLLAGGWPSQAVQYAISSGSQNTTQALDAAMAGVPLERNDPLRIISDTANRLGYTLYPIDVPGFQRADGIELGAATDSAFVSNFAASGETGQTRRDRELFLHDSLESLAFETGGEALINAQRMESLPLVRGDTRDYYWLGFSRDLQENDEHHSIDIEVLRPGLKVRSRKDFLDLSSKAQADMVVEGALLFDSFLDGGAGLLKLILGAPLDPSKKKLEVPLEVEIPLDGVTVLESAGQFVAELEVRVSVKDAKGNTAKSVVQAFSVRGDEPPGPGDTYSYSTVLEIRNRNHKIVVGVQDILGGLSLAGTTQLDPE
ncbi:MAG: VWA domain-containing protein [Acidobacteriota bacterium]|nr:VWA domain-containing protein [Acidobacteriota bacterium]